MQFPYNPIITNTWGNLALDELPQSGNSRIWSIRKFHFDLLICYRVKNIPFATFSRSDMIKVFGKPYILEVMLSLTDLQNVFNITNSVGVKLSGLASKFCGVFV